MRSGMKTFLVAVTPEVFFQLNELASGRLFFRRQHLMQSFCEVVGEHIRDLPTCRVTVQEIVVRAKMISAMRQDEYTSRIKRMSRDVRDYGHVIKGRMPPPKPVPPAPPKRGRKIFRKPVVEQVVMGGIDE